MDKSNVRVLSRSMKWFTQCIDLRVRSKAIRQRRGPGTWEGQNQNFILIHGDTNQSVRESNLNGEIVKKFPFASNIDW